MPTVMDWQSRIRLRDGSDDPGSGFDSEVPFPRPLANSRLFLELQIRKLETDEVLVRCSVVCHGLTITFLPRTLHSGRDFDDDDVTALQGLGGLPEGLGNLDGIVGWIHGKELLGVFWCHRGDLFGQRPKA